MSKLLNQPEEYARGAIASLSDQLKTARGSRRIAKLNRKLAEWSRALELLTEQSPATPPASQETEAK